MVYVGSRDYNVHCVSASDGKPIWKFKTGGFLVDVSLSDGKVYGCSHDNKLYCLDATTGEMIWNYKTNGIVNFATPHKDRVYFGSWDCKLYCVDAESGSLIWDFKTSLGTPSTITPPQSTVSKTSEVTWTPETEEEKKKYKLEGGGGDYEINVSQYGVMDKGYVSGKKKGYIK